MEEDLDPIQQYIAERGYPPWVLSGTGVPLTGMGVAVADHPPVDVVARRVSPWEFWTSLVEEKLFGGVASVDSIRRSREREGVFGSLSGAFEGLPAFARPFAQVAVLGFAAWFGFKAVRGLIG